jgi:hypothetical protein
VEPSVSLCVGGLGELPLMLWLIIKKGTKRFRLCQAPGLKRSPVASEITNAIAVPSTNSSDGDPGSGRVRQHPHGTGECGRRADEILWSTTAENAGPDR